MAKMAGLVRIATQWGFSILVSHSNMVVLTLSHVVKIPRILPRFHAKVLFVRSKAHCLVGLSLQSNYQHLLKRKAGNAWFPASRYLWWAQQDSNLQPRDYESPAPPLSYRPAREALGYSIPNGREISNSTHFLREKTRDSAANSTRQRPSAVSAVRSP